MTRRKTVLVASLIVVIAASVALVTGASILTRPTFGSAQIPAGTWITWIGFIALHMAILTGSRRLYTPESNTDRNFSYVIKAFLILAILWVPICYLLAGNMSFSFSEKVQFQGGQTAMKIFWYFNYALAGLPLGVLLIHLIRSFFIARNNTK